MLYKLASMYFMNKKVMATVYYVHTCCYSERCMANTIMWCSNPVFSSIGFSCISIVRLVINALLVVEVVKWISVPCWPTDSRAFVPIMALYHCTSSPLMFL